MKHTFNARIAPIIVTLWVVLGMGIGERAQAQMLDLNSLPKYFYKGEDRHRKGTCLLDAAPAEKDFVNRRTQVFRVATEKTDFSLSLLMSGGVASRPADFLLPGGLAQFNLGIETSRLEIVALASDPQRIQAFRVFGRSESGGAEGLMLDCKNVVGTAR